MSQTGSSAGLSDPTDSSYSEPRATGWVGWVVFAGTMMLLIGFFHIIEGLVAVLDPDYFLVTKSGLTVHLDYTAWGWTHLIAGVIIGCAGLGLFLGQMWARIVGVGARGDQRAAELRVHRGVPLLVPHRDRSRRLRDPRPDRARQGDQVLLGGRSRSGSFAGADLPDADHVDAGVQEKPQEIHQVPCTAASGHDERVARLQRHRRMRKCSKQDRSEQTVDPDLVGLTFPSRLVAAHDFPDARDDPPSVACRTSSSSIPSSPRRATS